MRRVSRHPDARMFAIRRAPNLAATRAVESLLAFWADAGVDASPARTSPSTGMAEGAGRAGRPAPAAAPRAARMRARPADARRHRRADRRSPGAGRRPPRTCGHARRRHRRLRRLPAEDFEGARQARVRPRQPRRAGDDHRRRPRRRRGRAGRALRRPRRQAAGPDDGRRGPDRPACSSPTPSSGGRPATARPRPRSRRSARRSWSGPSSWSTRKLLLLAGGASAKCDARSATRASCPCAAAGSTGPRPTAADGHPGPADPAPGLPAAAAGGQEEGVGRPAGAQARPHRRRLASWLSAAFSAKFARPKTTAARQRLATRRLIAVLRPARSRDQALGETAEPPPPTKPANPPPTPPKKPAPAAPTRPR